jgi:predicted dienelactone hydrolase
MEELASHGYVVVSVDHTYGAMATVFPDGEVILYNPEAIPSGVSQEEYQRGIDKLGDTWTDDLYFVLDQLELLHEGSIQSRLTGKLDMSRIGMLGHSTGGGAVVEACWSDTRCLAGFAMDAWLEPYSRQMAQQGLAQPFMFLESEYWNQDAEDENSALFHSLYENTAIDVYLLKISGAQHTDFADLPSLTPLFFLLRAQPPWYGWQILEMVNAYTLAFFDHYLRDTPAEVLDQTLSAYPKVDIQKR